MALGAVLVTFIGVLVGVLLLAEVAAFAELARYKAVHVVMALIATAIVCVAAFTASATVSWVAAAAVVGAASAGLVTWRRSLQTAPAVDGRRVSRPLLVVHGGAAALAFVLVVLAAVR